jgi:CheY-like chemotaxis protein
MATTILVVEDDSLNRDLICKVLRQEGHGVFEAGDGAQALELLYTRRFDLVITDYLMPKVDGVDLVEQVHLLQPNMPIIFMTGSLAAISGKAILDKVTEFLAKPFEPKVLISAVRRLFPIDKPVTSNRPVKRNALGFGSSSTVEHYHPSDEVEGRPTRSTRH